MDRAARSSRAHRTARWALGVAVLAAVGATWETAAERADRRAFPPPGHLVDVGGHRLHLLVAGAEHAGAPTVILEAGIGGGTSASWGWVQPGVARFARVVAYDRAGLGWSDPGPLPRDARRLAAELHAALGRAGLPGPYVYVGHSYGGLLARMFTQLYPGEVAGLVLVESSWPGRRGSRSAPRIPAWLRVSVWGSRAAPLAARLGVIRLALVALHPDSDRLPQRERAEQRAFLASPAQWRGIAAEMAAWVPLTIPEVRPLGGVGARPLVVLVAGRSARRQGGWLRIQRENASLSADGGLRVVPGASHASILEDPRHAPAVVEAVREVVEAVRDGRPLPPAAPPTPGGLQSYSQ